MVTERILNQLKTKFSKARFILYLYDSEKNIKGLIKKLKYFDSIHSFDRLDCQKYGFDFRPLFYCDEFINNPKDDNNYKYDLCFIGTIHSDRYKILKEIKRQADKEKLSIFMYPYLQSKFIYYFYKLTKREFKNTMISEFEFDKISSSNIKKKVNESRIIIDIQHPK